MIVETVLLALSTFEIVIFLLVAGCLVAGMQAERWRARSARAAWRQRQGGAGRQPRAEAAAAALRPGFAPFDAAEQLRCVMAASFSKRRLLNKAEARVLIAAERAVRKAGLAWRVMAQVSLGEIVASTSEAAFRAINSKRVDLLLVARDGEPLAAIEYQGDGHYLGTAAARDAIKKEALRRAGIAYIEVRADDGPEHVDREIARLAQRLAPPGASVPPEAVARAG